MNSPRLSAIRPPSPTGRTSGQGARIPARKIAVSAALVGALALSTAPAAQAAVGAQGNYINSLSRYGHLKDGGARVRVQATVSCAASNGWTNLQLQLSQSIGGTVYTAENNRDNEWSSPLLVCDGAPHVVGMYIWAASGQPAFHTGAATLRANLGGYRSNDTYFSYNTSKSITIKAT